MIKIFHFIISCLFIFGFIVSCDKAGNSSGPKTLNENMLRIDTFGAFPTLNPKAYKLGSSGEIFPLLYSFLCVPDETGELKPDLAQSWIYDPKTFNWTITLRDNAFFHNKRPVTSEDVVYSLLCSLKNSDTSIMDLVHEITPVSDTSLLICLKKDDPEFMKKIWTLNIFPRSVDDSAKSSEEASHPVGSGPFQYASKTGKEKVVLTANKNYYLGQPTIDSVEFYYQPDREKSWTRLLEGQTDIAFELSPENFEIIKQYEDQFYFDHYTMHRYSILLYNTHDPLFSDPKVRQALTHAINRDYIVNDMLRGWGKVACGAMGIDSPYHNPAVVPLSYDPPKSLELLKQSGWRFDNKGHYLYKDNKLFKFILTVIKEFPMEQAIARYIKLCFNDIGIQMSVDAVSLDLIAEKYRRNNDFQAVLTEFTDGYRCPEWLKEFWTPCYFGKSAAGCFACPEVTNLIEQAFSQNDSAQKIKHLQKADKVIASLQPGTFL